MLELMLFSIFRTKLQGEVRKLAIFGPTSMPDMLTRRGEHGLMNGVCCAHLSLSYGEKNPTS